MRRLPYSILKKLNGFWRPQFSIVRRLGTRFLLNRKNWIDQKLVSFQSYEKDNLNAMIELSSLHRFDKFYDIGANFGYFSILLGKKTEIPQIIAFEPLKRNYNQFCANIFLNELEEKITIQQIALGNKKEKTVIWFNDDSTGVSTLDPSNTVRDKDDYQRKENIECDIFDNLYKDEGLTVLAKIDVEGFEENTLRGMQNFLSHNKVILFVEVHKASSPVFAFLDKLEYIEISRKADDYIFSNI